jgi:hypothetical protein
MRKSLTAALAAWCIHVVTAYVWPSGPLQAALGLAALALSGLWLLHVVTYASRAVYLAQRKRSGPPSCAVSSAAEAGSGVDRRTAVGIFAKAAGTAAFASAAFFPMVAGATQHICGDGSRCEVGNKCCWNSNSETYFCCYSGHVCCVDGYSSYCRNPDIGEYC